MPKLKVRQIVPGLYEFHAQATSIYLIHEQGKLLLVDTGYPGWADSIASEITKLGFAIQQLEAVIVTHAHPDHSGSLAALQSMTRFRTLMHADEAEMVRQGKTKRRLQPSPGLLHWIIFQRYIATSPFQVDPAAVDETLVDGEVIQLVGLQLEVIHLPGHALGQIALLWKREGGNIALVADAAVNLFGLSIALASEDHDEMLASLKKLSQREFEIACFGHGKVINSSAANRFRKLWST